MVKYAVETLSERIASLFAGATDRIVIIAPFVKVSALSGLLSAVPHEVSVRCVTRWRPDEIAAGVSDPEIVAILEERGNYSLTLVDNLHAKIYIADDMCLTGSANVTMPGLGQSSQGNIEILVKTTVDNPDIVRVLAELARLERVASPGSALAARALANRLSSSDLTATRSAEWFPCSRRPDRAFALYSKEPEGFIGEVDRVVITDLARASLAAGLDEEGFRVAIAEKLSCIPLAGSLLGNTADITLKRADAQSYLESLQLEDFSTEELWLAFVLWMTYYLSDRVIQQEIAEVALRRGQVID